MGLHSACTLQAVRPGDEGEERECEHTQHDHKHHRTTLQAGGHIQAVHHQLQVDVNSGTWSRIM